MYKGVKCLEVYYAYIKQVFANIQCENLNNYMQLYILNNIYLLTDVFQMFKQKFTVQVQADQVFFEVHRNSRKTSYLNKSKTCIFW